MTYDHQLSIQELIFYTRDRISNFLHLPTEYKEKGEFVEFICHYLTHLYDTPEKVDELEDKLDSLFSFTDLTFKKTTKDVSFTIPLQHLLTPFFSEFNDDRQLSIFTTPVTTTLLFADTNQPLLTLHEKNVIAYGNGVNLQLQFGISAIPEHKDDFLYSVYKSITNSISEQYKNISRTLNWNLHFMRIS